MFLQNVDIWSISVAPMKKDTHSILDTLYNSVWTFDEQMISQFAH